MNRMTWGLLGLFLVCGAETAAQPREPVSLFVVDARGAFARFKADPTVASSLQVTAENLPTRGFGLGMGAHWYPIRRRLVSFGIGAEIALARDSRTADETDTTAARPTVTTRFSSVSPQVSINFGKRDGWSYLSGGIGRARMTTERDDVPSSDGAQRTQTINYGGGARWFTGRHLALSVDLRWYTVNAREASTQQPAYPRARMMVMSAGISLH